MQNSFQRLEFNRFLAATAPQQRRNVSLLCRGREREELHLKFIFTGPGTSAGPDAKKGSFAAGLNIFKKTPYFYLHIY
jgi:hypothetical protein